MTDETRETPGHSRRDVLKTGIAAAALGGVARGAPDESPDANKFFPEAYWRERMTPPDDGKKFGWVIDTRKCFGCHACEVSCKAENDVPLGKFIRQTIYQDYEKRNTQIARVMVPMSCQHCEDAPCIKACPCGALHKGAGGSVQINYDSCCGHAACVDVCPYGAIYIDPVANQAIKCHNCTHRIGVDMQPACVDTCPSEAIHFGDLNDKDSAVSKSKAALEAEDKLATLRPEKNTHPRMWFAVDKDRPMSLWEHRIPREGESYRSEDYSVFNWGKTK